MNNFLFSIKKLRIIISQNKRHKRVKKNVIYTIEINFVSFFCLSLTRRELYRIYGRKSNVLRIRWKKKKKNLIFFRCFPPPSPRTSRLCFFSSSVLYHNFFFFQNSTSLYTPKIFPSIPYWIWNLYIFLPSHSHILFLMTK